ncbi:hypothetical protein AAHE18_01G001500 [Arachis hypogaea]
MSIFAVFDHRRNTRVSGMTTISSCTRTASICTHGSPKDSILKQEHVKVFVVFSCLTCHIIPSLRYFWTVKVWPPSISTQAFILTRTHRFSDSRYLQNISRVNRVAPDFSNSMN